jgi:hypothetical protein
MAINSITITGANPKDFIQSNTCGTSLAAGAGCAITVVFKPTASGPRAAWITVSESDQVHPSQTVSLSGAGVVGVGQISSPLSFGAQLVNTSSSPQTVSLTNAGTAIMMVSSIAIKGTNPTAFTQTNSCGAALAPGAGCAISVMFKPTVAGASSALLTINTSDPASPALSVSLSGTGTTDFALSLASPSISAKSGSSATVNLNITSGSTFLGAIALTCSGLPAHSACSFAPATLNAAGDDAPLLSTMTITTGLTTASLERRPAKSFLLACWMGLPAFGFLGVFVAPTRVKAHRRMTLWVIAMMLAVMLIGLSVGCGGASSTQQSVTPPSTPLGSYSITVTATAGNISHSTLMTLFVQ